ncbi:MAG: HD-GYP domain-containing protein [Deferrisomatales bacterium]|nr:HD-GYP domain-containing protein [Deferrisomatales bacterium]
MIKKIRAENLDVGMFVTDFNTPWLNHSFVGNRMAIRTVRDIANVLKQGIVEVYIDTEKGKDSLKAITVDAADAALHGRLREEFVAAPRPGGDPQGETPFEEELRRAREIYEDAKEVVRNVFETVRRGGVIDGERPRATVTKMIDSIFCNRDALLTLVRVKSFDEYTLCHCLNVAVLSLHLGAGLGILQEELVRLGTGAILHDIGKVRLPAELVRKGGNLSRREVALVQRHAAQGADILFQCPSLSPDTVLVALNHHERYDGSGYPRGLANLQIGKFSLIVAIADVYDAMTSSRTYQERMSPTLALSRIFEWAGSYLHPIYAKQFIRCLGIYPIGSVVALDTGEVGVVLHENREQSLHPQVRLCRARDGRALPEPIDVDLLDPDPSGRKVYARTIQKVLPSRTAGVDVDAILSSRPNPGGAGPVTAIL